jgi:hypothetical protein
MELGGVLGEACGKVAGLKPIGDGKIEVSLQGKDKILGSYVDDIGTFWSATATTPIPGPGCYTRVSLCQLIRRCSSPRWEFLTEWVLSPEDLIQAVVFL